MRVRRKILGIGLLALLSAPGMLAVSGCQGPAYDTRWDQALDISGPYKLQDGSMLYIDRGLGRVLRVDPVRVGDDELDVELTRHALGGTLRASLLSPDTETLYLVDGSARQLHVVDLSQPEITHRSVALSSAYDQLTLDPEGEFLLLSFAPQSDDEDIIARNLNEVGIVDLRQQELTASFVTLSTRAQSLVFAPSFELGGSTQRLVAALGASEVSLLDLLADNEADRLREVPLTISEADPVKTPVQAIFDVTPEPDLPDTVSLYVRTAQGADITQIAIQPRVREDAPFKFDVSVNQFAAGTRPGAMALLELPERGSRLLVLDRSQPIFTLIDVASGEGSSFTLMGGAVASDLMVYTAERNEGTERVQELRVLAYSTQSPVVNVIRPETIAISGDQPTAGRSVESVRLERTPTRVEYDPSATADRAVVFHEGLKGGFTVMNLNSNRDIPIQGYSLNDVLFDGPYAYGVFPGTANFVVFELETGHPTIFELPRAGEAISLDEEQGAILVQHNGNTGTFTVLDAERPTAQTARVVRDLFLEGVFDEL